MGVGKGRGGDDRRAESRSAEWVTMALERFLLSSSVSLNPKTHESGTEWAFSHIGVLKVRKQHNEKHLGVTC